MTLLALHGFLGLPADWSSFSHELGFAIDARDLYSGAEKSFDEWTTEFIETFPWKRKPLLIGYSMGGRLAMHAALRAPERFAGAVFISANPGLRAGHAERIASDAIWAERFRSEPWEEVVAAWNAQPVLRTPEGAWSLERLEKNFSRPLLAKSLEQWSLGRQRDLRAELSELTLPHLFLTGSEDVKFTELTRSLSLSPRGSHRVIDGAGHRLPWDRPTAFAEAVREFASGL